MAGAAARESLTIAGRPEGVAVARAFAAAVLGRQHPASETAVLLLSYGEVTRVQVTDRSGATVPALRTGVSGTEDGGRGLYLVDSLAARWGFERDGDHTTTWFELQHR